MRERGSVMEIASGYESLQVSDGTTMRAWAARPKTGEVQAGLLVYQEAFGVNAHIRDITQRFASEGYLADSRANIRICSPACRTCRR